MLILFNKVTNKLNSYVNEINKIFFYLSKYKMIKKALVQNNVNKFKIFRFKRWHLGCAYFLGEISSEKIFIKVDTNLHLLKNEKIFYDVMKEVIPNNLLKLHFFHEEKEFQMVCFSYVDNGQDLSSDLVINNPNYLTEAVEILKEINIKSIIHRDIKLDNFMLSDGQLKIIDFAFSNSLHGNHRNFKGLELSSDYHADILKRLGSKYKPGDYLWNDFVSLKNVTQEIASSNQLTAEQSLFFQLIIDELEELSVNAYYTQ